MTVDLSGKRVLVCGILRSGINAALLARKLGAHVCATDLKPERAFHDELSILHNAGIQTVLGQNPDVDLLKNTDICVISPGIPYDTLFIKQALDMGIDVLPEIEFAANSCEAAIAAITGTNGKTTTTALLGEILKRVSPKSMALGNIGTAFSAYALQIPKDAYAVLEISSFQLEATKAFKPKAAAVIQISPDHLDRHKTLENYIACKAKIFENQDENDYAILNYDDEACRKIACNVKSKVIFISQKEELQCGIYTDGTSITARFPEGFCPAAGGSPYNERIADTAKLLLPGAHNIENVMTAIGVALALGVNANVIREAAESFAGVPHRIELVLEKNGVKYFNDSKATNPGSATKALLAMNPHVVLIGGGYDKHADFAEWVSFFRGRVRKLILIGETKDKIISECNKQGFLDYVAAGSLEFAVSKAAEVAKEGDSVLLSPACASWDMFTDYEERGNMFKELVKKFA